MLLGKWESDLYHLKWARFRTFSTLRSVLGLLSVRRGKYFWDVTGMGTASLSASGVPPPHLESLLMQWVPVWLSPV